MNAFLAATLIMISACGGTTSLDGSDASTGAPAEQQLRTLLPTWCPQICTKLIQCQSPGIDSSCQTQCNQFVSEEFLGQGDACAQLGLDFVNCANSATCTDLAASKTCTTDPTKRTAVCSSSTGDSSQPTPGTIAPPQNVPTSPAPDASVGTVTCHSGSGIATVSPAPVGSLVCDTTLTGCTDGHTYRFTCINQGNDTVACTCYFDALVEPAFLTAGTGCPSSIVVNTSCGWQLGPM